MPMLGLPWGSLAGGRVANPILAPDGTVSLPAFTFYNDPDTGLYRIAANSVGIVTAGVLRFNVDANGLINLGGVAAAATTSSQILKAVTGIADATATAVLTVTVPNAAHSATVRITVVGSLGTGGAIGANEASGTVSYDLAVTRFTGVAMGATISSAYGSGMAATVGSATVTVTVANTLNGEGVGATNTATLKVTITKSAGSSANHTCLVYAQILNANATGITIS